MDHELKEQLARIELKLDQILRRDSFAKESSNPTATEAEPKTSPTHSSKVTTTGIPSPKTDPRAYNEAMKKYDTPDGNT